MENNKNMIITVPFSELKIWDVKSFYHQSDIFNKKYPVVLFGEFLTKPNIAKIQIQDTKEYKILGARAYGKGAFVNRTVKGDTLKMRTYQQAKPNHLFWCKVDTKNGAFGIITEELADGVASSNMTFAKIETEKANPEFLQLLFKSKRINEYMDGYVSGTTNRKYIKPDQLREEIKIVLPSIEEQNRIVNSFISKNLLAEQQEQEANIIENEIDNYIYEILGIKRIEEKKLNSFRTINFSEIERWAVDSLGKLTKVESKFESKYPLVKLRDFIKSHQYGLSEKATKESIGVPMLRMNNIFNSSLDISNLKYIDIDKFLLEKYKLDFGDILFNRTNSKELVGKTALFDIEDKDFTFASYIIRIKLDEKKANNKYINYLFNSSILQYQKDLVSRQITGQANINAQEMQDFLFPLPPLNKQNEIADYISNLKNKVSLLRESARLNNYNAMQEFENEIFNS
ncbi:restriction modification system DNA specificity domain-containing protein [Flavobacterium columnare]|uniref:restriction endonuclease subunit S n=1 Tax=Flavobacterium columnare TaxID=996 RepID=UPI0007F9AB4D|nr:restriction endonuclease subunit S [Flavobacterium columnare]ANO48844.1 restriction modification system DNA specificity domain-containing protein [Flavobacterium columnare]APT23130.1 hypothetical protein BU993_11210 [Flavobacterium columnare]